MPSSRRASFSILLPSLSFRMLRAPSPCLDRHSGGMEKGDDIVMWRWPDFGAARTSFLRSPRRQRVQFLFALVVVLQSLALEAIEASNPIDLRREKPIGIVILAQGRSGSTLLGETFRQNKVQPGPSRNFNKYNIDCPVKEVLYFYEPCRARGDVLHKRSSKFSHDVSGPECSDLIRRLTTCEFSKEDVARLVMDQTALQQGSPEVKRLLSAKKNPTVKKVAQVYKKILGSCKTKRAVVVKTIRMYSGPYGIDGGNSELRVVHLVRDPRAVSHSQIELFNLDHKYEKFFHPEEWSDGGDQPFVEDNTELMISRMKGLTPPPWSPQERAYVVGLIICSVYEEQLKSFTLGENRYLLVRYEDIVSSMKSSVERIYHWSGLGDVPAEVNQWIDENTQTKGCEEDEGKQPMEGQSDVGGRVGLVIVDASKGNASDCAMRQANRASRSRYGTRRPSAAMAELWRTQMSKEEADAVWEACKSSMVMETLGYKP